MFSDAHVSSFTRLALALASAGLLAASLPGADGAARLGTAAVASAAGDSFDPLLDAGPALRLRPGRRRPFKLPTTWLRRRRRQDRDRRRSSRSR